MDLAAMIKNLGLPTLIVGEGNPRDLRQQTLLRELELHQGMSQKGLTQRFQSPSWSDSGIIFQTNFDTSGSENQKTCWQFRPVGKRPLEPPQLSAQNHSSWRRPRPIVSAKVASVAARTSWVTVPPVTLNWARKTASSGWLQDYIKKRRKTCWHNHGAMKYVAFL